MNEYLENEIEMKKNVPDKGHPPIFTFIVMIVVIFGSVFLFGRDVLFLETDEEVVVEYYKGHILYAPVDVIDQRLGTDAGVTWYELDVKVEDDLDYLFMIATFKSTNDVIIDEVKVEKFDLDNGSTYRFRFETTEPNVAKCALNSSEVFYPEDTEVLMSSICTGDNCTVTSGGDD